MADQLQSPTMPGLTGIGGVINGQDPNYLYSVMQAQRQKMIADALTQQSMGGIDYDKNGAISPLQGLAKTLQAYTGMKGAAAANHTLADAQAIGNQRTMQGLNGLFGGAVQDPTVASETSMRQGAMTQPSTLGADGQPVNQGGIGPTLTNAQRMGQMLSGGTGSQGAAFTVPGMTPQQMTMAYLLDPQATMKAALDAKAQTPEMKNNQWMGYTPEMALRGKVAADIKAGDMEHKAGNQWANAYTGQTGYAPKIPDNAQPGGVGPNGQIVGGVTAIPGAQQIEAQTAGMVKNQEQANTVGTATAPSGATVPVWNGLAADAGTAQLGLGNGGGQGSYPAPTGSTSWTGSQLSPQALTALKSKADAGDQEAQAALAGYAAKFGNDPRQFLPGPGRQGTTPAAPAAAEAQPPKLGADPTIQTARTAQQTDLAAKWKPLNEAVSNAATVNSRLDTIRDLATKASTGQFSDKLQFVNSLLSMAGSEKATDANTAKVLLDKNSNQIVAQLGQGGMATDAARAIITSAYPNSHMPQAAIEEASNNLKAANNMLVSKAQVLMPHYLNSDPVAYQKAEQEFNQVADPRIFQWDAMKGDPKAQAAFAAKLMKQDPTIVDRIHALEQMGALKK